MDALGKVRRTHDNNSLTAADAGREVVLTGWAQRRRDHGGVIFVDLRDREGITQIVFNPERDPAVHEKAKAIRGEYVLGVRGIVSLRPEGMENPNLETGAVEVLVSELWIFNTATTPPFMIEDQLEVSESLRLQYRWLDLRRPRMVRNMTVRHKASRFVREFLNEHGFLEMETPFLTKSTPEGARDYLVPSRVNPGLFYALPQSPQLFKQLLMMAGYERYYQVVRCFRDEDLRADRQPEFTQIDMEMSFVGEEDIMDLSERMIAGLFDAVLGVTVPLPFQRITYETAMDLYGSDKPDLRFGLPLCDVTDIVAKSGFKVFAEAALRGGIVKALNAKGASELSRKDLDDLTRFVSVYGAKGLAWIKVKEKDWQSPIAKFFSDDEKAALSQKIGMEQGDLVFFVADTKKVVNEALGHLRLQMAERMKLIEDECFAFAWVTEFPLMEYDETEKRNVALHHPFTAPMDEDLALLESEPARVRSRAYDMVLNGTEIGGGSIRIHQRPMQEKIFSALSIEPSEAEEKFGFLLSALASGAPPHGGLAFGFDRLIAILCGEKSIRDVIAFPKTQKAACLMTQAPSPVSALQLTELSLRVSRPE